MRACSVSTLVSACAAAMSGQILDWGAGGAGCEQRVAHAAQVAAAVGVRAERSDLQYSLDGLRLLPPHGGLAPHLGCAVIQHPAPSAPATVRVLRRALSERGAAARRMARRPGGRGAARARHRRAAAVLLEPPALPPPPPPLHLMVPAPAAPPGENTTGAPAARPAPAPPRR